MVNEAPFVGFPYFNFVFNQPIASLYRDYMMSGTGKISLIFFAIIVIIQLLFGNSRQKSVSKCVISLTALTSLSGNFFVIGNHKILESVVGLPALSLPIVIFYLIQSALVLYLIVDLAKKIKQSLHPFVLRLFLLAVVVFTMLLYMPLFTGELWYF